MNQAEGKTKKKPIELFFKLLLSVKTYILFSLSLITLMNTLDLTKLVFYFLPAKSVIVGLGQFHIRR